MTLKIDLCGVFLPKWYTYTTKIGSNEGVLRETGIIGKWKSVSRVQDKDWGYEINAACRGKETFLRIRVLFAVCNICKLQSD